MLREAQAVHILEIKERGEEDTALAPDASIAGALSRHGIKPEVRTSIASDISVGDDIFRARPTSMQICWSWEPWPRAVPRVGVRWRYASHCLTHDAGEDPLRRHTVRTRWQAANGLAARLARCSMHDLHLRSPLVNSPFARKCLMLSFASTPANDQTPHLFDSDQHRSTSDHYPKRVCCTEKRHGCPRQTEGSFAARPAPDYDASDATAGWLAAGHDRWLC